MKIYSPSQTSRAMRCPMLNTLYREGWRIRKQGMPILAANAGKAIAAGLGMYNNYRKQLEAGGRDITSLNQTERAEIAKAAMGLAFTFMAREMEEVEKLGYVLGTDSEPYLKSIQDRVGKSITAYILKDPLSPSWRIVDIEKSLGVEYGDSRPDLVIRDDFGLAIVDYKTQSQASSGYGFKLQHAKNTEWEQSFQMKHYCHFGTEVYKEPVQRYYICQITTSSQDIKLLPFEVSGENLALWYQATVPMWEYMKRVEDGIERPWMAAEHATKYGPCEMYAACFRYNLEPQLMQRDYVQVERVKDA